MTRSILAIPLGMVFFSVVPPALAQDQSARLPLKLEDISLTCFDELYLNRSESGQRGFVERLQPKDRRFLSLRAVIVPSWNEKIAQVTVPAEKIVLVHGKEEFKHVGRLVNGGDFVLGMENLAMIRPADWKNTPHRVVYSCVYLVPRNIDSVEFRLADAVVKLDVPKQASPAPIPAHFVDIKVLDSQLVEEAAIDMRVGGIPVKTIINNPNGMLLKVRFRLAPKRTNQNNGNFLWHTSWIGVVLDNGAYVPAAAEGAGETITKGVGHQIDKPKSGSPWPAYEQTFYFAVPKSTTTFKLAYLMTPVADGKVR
ncbi:MAG: hypothetical protein KatS3mg105_0483 [Gemmatales bacterium]|nr:MAG: hypothetical protein KatS3mg105_0483 [Gemmatales bacterium]